MSVGPMPSTLLVHVPQFQQTGHRYALHSPVSMHYILWACDVISV